MPNFKTLPISEGGKLIGHCRNHTIDYMKTHREPIRTHELVNALERDAPRVGIPQGRGNGTRREAYMAVITSLRQERKIETDLEWYMIWHEYAADNIAYRGRIRS